MSGNLRTNIIFPEAKQFIAPRSTQIIQKEETNEEETNEEETNEEETNEEETNEEETNEEIFVQNKYDKLYSLLKFTTDYPNDTHKGTFAIGNLQVMQMIYDLRWELNRPIDENHVKELYNVYEKNPSIPFYDNIHVAYLKTSDSFRIIEGQHRMRALGGLFFGGKLENLNFPLVLWEVNDDNEMMHLLHIINNRKIFEIERFVNYDISDIVTKFGKKYKIVNEKGNADVWGKNRPHINKELFIEKLREKIDHISRNYQPIELFFNKLDEINKDIGKKTRKDKGGSKKVNDTADRSNFYLGLDRDLTWFDEIYKN